MKIKWNGHASFTITAANGTIIITDPYEPGGYDGAIGYDPIQDQADAVLVSHDHADHNHVQGLKGSPAVLKGSGEVKGVQVTGVESFHDESEGSERGRNMLFAFTIDDIRVCFVGDLGHQLSKEQLAAIGDVDLLLVPIGGTFTLDHLGAASLIEAASPKAVIPMHFKNKKCNLPIAPPDKFLSHMLSVKQLQQSEIELGKQDIPEGGPEIWVLNYAC